MFSLVRLTEGNPATDIDLTDTRRYALQSYTPAVAALRASPLGGTGVYQDVTDTITFHAIGATPTAAMQHAAAVNDMLNQAWRWSRGEAVNQVRIRVQLQAGGKWMEAIVRGRPENASNLALSVKPRVDAAAGYVAENITMQFIRDGDWLEPADLVGGIIGPTDSGTAAGAYPGDVRTISLGRSHDAYSPITLYLRNTPNSAATTLYLATGPVDSIQTFEAESFAELGMGGVSAPSDGYPRGGGYARLDNGANGRINIPLSGIRTDARQFFVLLPVRKNLETTSYTIQVEMWNASNVTIGMSEVVTANWTPKRPRMLCIGPITTTDLPARTIVNVTRIGSAGSPTNSIDIDYVTLVAVGRPDAHLVRIDGRTWAGGQVVINNLAPLPTPRVESIDAVAVAAGIAYTGPVSQLCLRGSELQVAVMACDETSSLPNVGTWQWRDGSTLAATAFVDFALARRRAYLIPE